MLPFDDEEFEYTEDVFTVVVEDAETTIVETIGELRTPIVLDISIKVPRCDDERLVCSDKVLKTAVDDGKTSVMFTVESEIDTFRVTTVLALSSGPLVLLDDGEK